MTSSGPVLVQALYSFKAKNNDELNFKKGDIITVTQKEDGGWWEGTLSGETRWFPSNYIKEYKPQDAVGSPKSPTTTKLPQDVTSQQKVYRNLVLKDLIDSEGAHVVELTTLIKNFLHPLEKADVLTRDEYKQLVGNIDAVVDTHNRLLLALEDCHKLTPSEQRVGKLFLTSAPHIKQTHLLYCSSHYRAICILNKHKDTLNTFMESRGAANPGLLVLTTGLSKPFRRLEKYAGILKELERHIEENHQDRGDTQRSISVYADIWSACSTRRRQKEQELEVLTGGVRGWEGDEDISSLGEILHMGSVAVGSDHRDRYFVLFPTTLLMLSVSLRMSGFIYEGKLPLTSINVNMLPDTDTHKNAFEIHGPMIEKITAHCQTKEDQISWVDSIRSAMKSLHKSVTSPTPPPHMSLVRSMSMNNYNTNNNSTNVNNSLLRTDKSEQWSVSCLKPLPPMRPCVAFGKGQGDKCKQLSPKKSVDQNFEEDIQILRVIEAYCGGSAKNRVTINSGRASSNAGFLRDHSTSSLFSEKYVMEDIDVLKNQMSDVRTQLIMLSLKLQEETKQRLALQNSVRTRVLSLS